MNKDTSKRKIIIVIVAAVVVAGILSAVLIPTVFVPNAKYNAAVELYKTGKFDEAIEAFKALNGYRDSKEQIEKCETGILDAKYEAALELYKTGKYDEAIAAFKALNGYKDSEEQIKKCETGIIDAKYEAALELLKAGKYEEAYMAFISLDYKDSADKADECLFEEQKASLKDITVNSVIKFGYYEQDNDTTNGKEEIEWIVLYINSQENKALVISRYALDCLQFDEYYTTKAEVRWEGCTLRKWLNETFINEAFGPHHQEMILNSNVTADGNPNYGSVFGNDTVDKVFLLSIKEANTYFSSNEARICRGTEYCNAHGPFKDEKGNCWWWLRTVGSRGNYSANVYWDGVINVIGYNVLAEQGCVRPAFWINLGK